MFVKYVCYNYNILFTDYSIEYLVNSNIPYIGCELINYKVNF